MPHSYQLLIDYITKLITIDDLPSLVIYHWLLVISSLTIIIIPMVASLIYHYFSVLLALPGGFALPLAARRARRISQRVGELDSAEAVAAPGRGESRAALWRSDEPWQGLGSSGCWPWQ